MRLRHLSIRICGESDLQILTHPAHQLLELLERAVPSAQYDWIPGCGEGRKVASANRKVRLCGAFHNTLSTVTHTLCIWEFGGSQSHTHCERLRLDFTLHPDQ